MIALGSTQFKAAYLGSTKLKNIALGGSLLLNKIFKISDSSIIDFSLSYAYNNIGTSSRVAVESIGNNFYSVPPDCTHLALVSKELNWSSVDAPYGEWVARAPIKEIYLGSVESGSTIYPNVSYPKTKISTFSPASGTYHTIQWPKSYRDGTTFNKSVLYAYNGPNKTLTFNNVGLYAEGEFIPADRADGGSYGIGGTMYGVETFDVYSTMFWLSYIYIPIGWYGITGGSYTDKYGTTYNTTITSNEGSSINWQSTNIKVTTTRS